MQSQPSRWKLFWKLFWKMFTFDTTTTLPRLPQTNDILNTSDEDAVRQDWEAVGRDMQKSIDDFEDTLTENNR